MIGIDKAMVTYDAVLDKYTVHKSVDGWEELEIRTTISGPVFREHYGHVVQEYRSQPKPPILSLIEKPISHEVTE